MAKVPVIIPSYQPDQKLIELLMTFMKADVYPVIVVDDGGGEDYRTIFSMAKELMGDKMILLTHEVNHGKGAALKTAFKYVLENLSDASGVVTADSDGQHDVDSILSVKKALEENDDALILGVRTFDSDKIPWKSKFGNTLTRKVVAYVSGLDISDTQTGLRGIPTNMLPDLLKIKSDRYEFEMKMLLEAVNKYKKQIVEIPIKTIYESKDNHKTHFNPVLDSVRIYRVLGAQLFKFLFASLSSSVIDLAAFQILCIILKGYFSFYVALATVIARIISASYNCFMNYKVVFGSSKDIKKAVTKYIVLAILQMSVSALLVTALTFVFGAVPEVVIKAIVDTLLFFISYKIQQKYIF